MDNCSQFKVLEFKTNLQRVRASNERRRAKLSQRWGARAAAAAAERGAAAERQRAFTRQLEADVDNMEEKLGALERQVKIYVPATTGGMLFFGGWEEETYSYFGRRNW